MSNTINSMIVNQHDSEVEIVKLFNKYDCSSADINPIGGINKTDIKAFLKYFSEQVSLPVFNEIAEAQPSAELRPHNGGSYSS